jgi:hypothetical protein
MAITLTRGPQVDTRGLPEGYDPHKLYEYRYDTLIKNSSGLESFLFKLMPISMVKSFAFAVDPTYRFKVSPRPITPHNRTRYRGSISVLQQRTYRREKWLTAYEQTPNYKLVSFCWSPHFVYRSVVDPVASGSITAQPTLQDRLQDTTSRTRIIGSEQGTFKMFKGTLSSPPRSTQTGTVMTGILTGTAINQPLCGEVGGILNRAYGSTDMTKETHAPTGATLSTGAYNQLRDGELALCQALCQKHAISMLKDINPLTRRDYTLFRNLVELRDVPRSIVQAQKTLLDLSKLYRSLTSSPTTRKVIFNLKENARNVPNEYLSYHFGWKQLYRDLKDLLELPTKTSKRVNFLMRRSGKPTTLSSLRDIVSSNESGVSGFDYNGMSTEHTVSSGSRIERTSQVRLVVNCLWDFPPVNSVAFKRHVYAERIGLVPRPTDVYNLIPWTWLIDWFTGLGNYVELIDNIHRDRTLINWGMISCTSTGRLLTERKSKSTIVRDSRADNGTGSTTTTFVENNHTSVFDFKCKTRSDVSTILDVKLTSVPTSLTVYQKSILGALIAQRANFKR